ncbi:hypothetical protein, partial [Chromobacterium sp. LK11]
MKKLALLALTAAFSLVSVNGFAAEKAAASAPVAIHKAKKAEKKVAKKEASAAQKAQAAKAEASAPKAKKAKKHVAKKEASAAQ